MTVAFTAPCTNISTTTTTTTGVGDEISAVVCLEVCGPTAVYLRPSLTAR